MKLGKPALVAVGAIATAIAFCGVLLSTQAAFTARETAGTLPITAGRLTVELTTTPPGRERISVDLSSVGPDLMWPDTGALPLSLHNTGDLDGVFTRLETTEVHDSGAAPTPLSRVLEVAISGDAGQDWADPALPWRRVATAAEPHGRVIASDLGDLPADSTRTVYLKVRFTAEGEQTAYAAATAGFRLAFTVEQRL